MPVQSKWSHRLWGWSDPGDNHHRTLTVEICSLVFLMQYSYIYWPLCKSQTLFSQSPWIFRPSPLIIVMKSNGTIQQQQVYLLRMRNVAQWAFSHAESQASMEAPVGSAAKTTWIPPSSDRLVKSQAVQGNEHRQHKEDYVAVLSTSEHRTYRKKYFFTQHIIALWKMASVPQVLQRLDYKCLQKGLDKFLKVYHWIFDMIVRI